MLFIVFSYLYNLIHKYVPTYIFLVYTFRNLADQFTLFTQGWADHAPHTTASPLRLKKLSTPLLI